MTQLTDAQKVAVQSIGKNLCVSAGAGTGKTRVLVERFL
jgi:ATP-dependent helicase/nuclease subunit A